MQLLLLILGIAGVVLPEYFSGQNALGWAFIFIFAVITLVQIIWFVFVASKVKKTHDDFRRGWFS